MTDYTIASRTLLFDQGCLDWSAPLLELAELRPEQLPRARPGGTWAGTVTSAASQQTGMPAGTPCTLGGHDHLCAAFAVGAYQPGTIVDSSGTAEAVVMVLPGFVTGPALAQEGYACYTHVVPNQFVLKGGLKAAGGAIEWLARQLSGPGAPLDSQAYETLAAAAEPGVARRAGPLWLPHWLGSGTPQGNGHSRAALVGVQLEHDSGDLFRGLLESLAFWLRHNLEVMQALTGQIATEVFLLGGTTRLPLLSQIKADVLNLPVILPREANASAIGAALLAGLGTGVFASPAEAVASRRDQATTLRPDPARVAWYDRLYVEAYSPLYDALRQIHQLLD